MKEDDLSAQTEWFHQFAKQSVDEIAQQASDENRARFLRYAITSLPNHRPPEGLLPEEFAKLVIDLRENERGWNQALMSALIKAEDLHKSQDSQGAVSLLKEFSDSCPWKLFQEVAQGQAFHYKPR